MRKIFAVLTLSLALLTSVACAPLQENGSEVAPTSASMEEACQAIGALASEDPEKALQLIDEALISDASQEQSGLTECEPERLAALRNAAVNQLQDEREEPNLAVQAQENWDRFITSWVMPWQSLALAWASVVVGLLILSRFFAFLPNPVMPFEYLPWKYESKWIRGVAFWIGLFLIVWCSLLCIVRLQQVASPPSPEALQELVVPGTGAIIGAFLFATWASSRQRISVEVRDEKGDLNEPSAMRVLAFLNDLGGAPPRGLEVPRGTDATGLSELLLTASGAKGVSAAILGVLQSVFGLTPWRVVIGVVSEESMSITVTRNHRTEEAANISRSDRLIFPCHSEKDTSSSAAIPPVDLHKMAAAFILAILARHYQGYGGLAGATDWRSIGLQALATTDYEGHKDQQLVLLARAVELDPDNLPAEAAMRNIAHRHSHDIENQETYRQWLTDKLNENWKQRFNQRSLLNRLRFTYVCVTLNLIAATPTTDTELRLNEALSVAEKLVEGLEKLPRRANSLEKRLRLHTALVYADVLWKREKKTDPEKKPDPVASWSEPWKTWHKEAMSSAAPSLAYSSACSLAINSDSKWPEVKLRLDAAVVDRNLREFALIDPELAAYAQTCEAARKYLDSLKEPQPQKSWLQSVLSRMAP